MRDVVHVFDLYIGRLVQRLSPHVRPVMEVASLSGYPILTLTVAVGLLWVGVETGDVRLMQYGALICIVHAIGSALKLLFARKRPTTYMRKRWSVQTHSFPSGHAVGSTMAYGTLGILCIWVNFYLLAALFFVWPILVGISRIYLGAHYPSDVVAGWIIGGTGLVFTLYL